MLKLIFLHLLIVITIAENEEFTPNNETVGLLLPKLHLHALRAKALHNINAAKLRHHLPHRRHHLLHQETPEFFMGNDTVEEVAESPKFENVVDGIGEKRDRLGIEEEHSNEITDLLKKIFYSILEQQKGIDLSQKVVNNVNKTLSKEGIEFWKIIEENAEPLIKINQENRTADKAVENQLFVLNKNLSQINKTLYDYLTNQFSNIVKEELQKQPLRLLNRRRRGVDDEVMNEEKQYFKRRLEHLMHTMIHKVKEYSSNDTVIDNLYAIDPNFNDELERKLQPFMLSAKQTTSQDLQFSQETPEDSLQKRLEGNPEHVEENEGNNDENIFREPINYDNGHQFDNSNKYQTFSRHGKGFHGHHSSSIHEDHHFPSSPNHFHEHPPVHHIHNDHHHQKILPHKQHFSSHVTINKHDNFHPFYKQGHLNHHFHHKSSDQEQFSQSSLSQDQKYGYNQFPSLPIIDNQEYIGQSFVTEAPTESYNQHEVFRRSAAFVKSIENRDVKRDVQARIENHDDLQLIEADMLNGEVMSNEEVLQLPNHKGRAKKRKDEEELFMFVNYLNNNNHVGILQRSIQPEKETSFDSSKKDSFSGLQSHLNHYYQHRKFPPFSKHINSHETIDNYNIFPHLAHSLGNQHHFQGRTVGDTGTQARSFIIHAPRNWYSKHEIFKRSVPILRLIVDPNVKLDMPKTMENIGTVTKNSFEDDKAPMYHIRNMVGSAKNVILAALRIPPQDAIIPTQYKIMDRSDLQKNKLPEFASRFADIPDEDKFVDVFKRMGLMFRESVKSGQETLQHMTDVAHSARKAIVTTGQATPRLLTPYVKATAIKKDKDPEKLMLITPRIGEVTDEESLPDPTDEYVKVGDLMDAFGVSNPEKKKVGLTRFVMHPKKQNKIESRFGNEQKKKDFFLVAEHIDDDDDVKPNRGKSLKSILGNMREEILKKSKISKNDKGKVLSDNLFQLKNDDDMGLNEVSSDYTDDIEDILNFDWEKLEDVSEKAKAEEVDTSKLKPNQNIDFDELYKKVVNGMN